MLRKFGLSVFLLALFVLQPAAGLAQSSRRAEIRRIDAYTRQVSAQVKKLKRPQLFFADFADYTENQKPRWRKFTSAKAFEKAQESEDAFNTALVWQKNGRIIMANFTYSSPSGDWARYVYHYFRPDGTLAKAEAELRTFHGSLIVLQDFYFDRRGRVLRRSVRHMDLRTGQPKTPEKEVLDANADFINNVRCYTKTSRLPFARLLKAR